MRVWISGGGTGGHVYPALAVAAQLESAATEVASAAQRPAAVAPPAPPLIQPGHPGPTAATADLRHAPPSFRSGAVELLWVGSQGGMEEALVTRAGIAYRGVATGKLRGANPIRALQTGAALLKGVRQSQALLAKTRPDVCFVTGGYVCAPVVIACALAKVPIVIYLPDMTPGWTIRWMSQAAQRVCVSFEEVAPHFGGLAPQGKAIVTGYPVRAELVYYTQDRAAARTRLAQALARPLDEPQTPLVLVWGGSQGSRNINQSTWAALETILPHAHVLHVVGTRDWPLYEEQRAIIEAQRQAQRYHPVPYLHEEMSLALAAADLSVARAGASTLGEFPVARLPSILVPLVSVNQSANADLLAARGGAVVISDEALPGSLGDAVVSLLRNPARRQAMEDALSGLARPQAALEIARTILSLGMSR